MAADRYAAASHPGVPPGEVQARIDWLYTQCDENDAAEAIAGEQGWMAPALFPNTANDRHSHPLHCLSLADDRFGMHTNHDSSNPPLDPEGPGGTASLNVSGDFMYAHIGGKARFLMRYEVWTIDDRNGVPLNPVKVNQHPTYLGTPQTTVALLNFAAAYQPVSVWVEMPDTMATANPTPGILPGRRLAARTWMESRCHDKRDPTNIPQMLIDRVQDLGWLDPAAMPQSSRAIRFVANGDPNQASSWSLRELAVTLPGQIFTTGPYKWFHDSAVVYSDVDIIDPSVDMDHEMDTVFAGPTVTFTGWASDNVGVADVSVGIKDRETFQFLQADGTFGPYAELPVTLDSPGAAFTTWSITVTLPEASYNIEAWAHDAAGNEAGNPTWKRFEVGPLHDSTPPSVAADHSAGTHFTGPAVTLHGDAADDVGVDSVDVTIRNGLGEYLQPDGTFASVATELGAVLDSPGAAATSWSITVGLPDGSYDLGICARDAEANEGIDNAAGFVVVATDDKVRPSVPLVDYAAGAIFTGPNVTLSGTATDNVGVTAVRIKLKDRNSGQWLQSDGSFGTTIVLHDATVSSPGATSVTWSIEFVLPAGRFNPTAEAFDAAGNSRTQTDWRPVKVI